LIGYFKKNNDQVGEDYVQLYTAFNLSQTGQFNTALNQSLQILSRFEARHDNYGIINAYHEIGLALYFSGDLGQCIIYYKKAMSLALLSGDKHILSTIYNDIGTTYNEMNKPDSGLIYAQKAVNSDYENNDSLNLSTSLSTLGECYIDKKEYDKAIPFIKKSIWIAKAFDNYHGISWELNDLAQIFLETNQLDSARYYAQMAVELSNENSFKGQVLRAYEYLYKSYEKTDTKDSVYKYFRLSINTKDSLYTAQKAKDMQTFSFREQLRQQEIEQDKIQLQNKIRTYAMLSGLIVLLVIGFILYRNNRQKQKANKVLEKTLTDLKSTQSQLIQSEKMASLGELTAGIAHEIQNPLNFVNNFSEVNMELIEEMKQEIEKGNMDEVKAIANDIADNEQKITQHGKRADAIVKGMLQHSRSSTGVKEPANINALADEYLRLAYHGLRAKDKSFNATMKTDFDETIGKIDIIPQDIGRVILNLITNAFYAVNEKKQMKPEDYEPTVSVTTKLILPPTGGPRRVLISVKDNGPGIPQNIVDKIFQPFFSTKPTGSGTGLGLSLSYDIVKVHGGELKVETKEDEGSEFLIFLPFTIN
jgi:signal transduction histidine kinase